VGVGGPEMDEFCGAVHDEIAAQERLEAVVSVVRELAEAGIGLGPGPGLRVVGIVKGVGDGSASVAQRAPAVAP